MYERITRTIEATCRDCDTTFTYEQLGSRPKLLCDDCLRESKRRATREYQRRRRAAQKAEQPERQCRDCGLDISDRKANALRCVECIPAHRAAEQREYQQKLRKERGPRQFWCVRCDALIDRVGNSGRPLYCAACKEAVRAAAIRRDTARRRALRGTTFAMHCSICTTEFSRPKQRGPKPPTCFACQRQRHYAYIHARTDARRGSEAPCPDCGVAVQLKRRGPTKVRCRPCRVKRQREVWRELGKIYNNMRRAWKLANGWEKFHPNEVFDRDGWKCGICRRGIRQDLRYPHLFSVSLDHVVPLSKGGGHFRVNTQAAHLRCNLRKNNRLPKHLQLALVG